MSLISFGLKSIKCGPVPDDGTMSTMLAELGHTYKGSASLKEDDASVFDVESEESDDPEASFTTRGKKMIAASLFDYSKDVLLATKGGEIAADGAWEEPDQSPNIVKSWQLISKTNVLFEIPKGSLSATFNAEFKKDGVALLDLKIRINKSTNPLVKAIRITDYQNPVVAAGADQPITVNHADLVGTATPYRGTIASRQWSVVSKPDGATPVFGTGTALSTALTGLTVDGIYVVKLTVVDSNGFTNSDTVSITVTLP